MDENVTPKETREVVLIGGALREIPRRVREAILPIVNDLGYELVGVELAQEGHRVVLWVYIDHPDGVTIDGCAKVSPEVSAALDVADPVVEAYDLRVSSPGLDRVLTTDRDFERFAGREVQLQLETPVGGRKKFTGKIERVEGDRVVLACADGEHGVPLAAIQKARLKYVLR